MVSNARQHRSLELKAYARMHPEATSSLVSLLMTQDIGAYPCLRVTALGVL